MSLSPAEHRLMVREINTAEQLHAHLGSGFDFEDACGRVERWLRLYRSVGRVAIELQRHVAGGNDVSGGVLVELGWSAAEEWIKLRIVAGDVLAPEGVS